MVFTLFLLPELLSLVPLPAPNNADEYDAEDAEEVVVSEEEEEENRRLPAGFVCAEEYTCFFTVNPWPRDVMAIDV